MVPARPEVLNPGDFDGEHQAVLAKVFVISVVDVFRRSQLKGSLRDSPLTVLLQ